MIQYIVIVFDDDTVDTFFTLKDFKMCVFNTRYHLCVNYLLIVTCLFLLLCLLLPVNSYLTYFMLTIVDTSGVFAGCGPSVLDSP